MACRTNQLTTRWPAKSSARCGIFALPRGSCVSKAFADSPARQGILRSRETAQNRDAHLPTTRWTSGDSRGRVTRGIAPRQDSARDCVLRREAHQARSRIHDDDLEGLENCERRLRIFVAAHALELNDATESRYARAMAPDAAAFDECQNVNRTANCTWRGLFTELGVP